MNLSEADKNAINLSDSDYILNKGAKLYNEGKYEEAIEYYRIASAMGNTIATSNLGYCYMYGRSVDKNINLAIAYFKIASQDDNVDALHKLGDIYNRGCDEIKEDKELAMYYFDKAISILDEAENLFDEFAYPSLFYTMSKEYMGNGSKNPSDLKALEYLLIAKIGYEEEIENGATYYQKAYEEVCRLLEREDMKEAREDYEDNEYINFLLARAGYGNSVIEED